MTPLKVEYSLLAFSSWDALARHEFQRHPACPARFLWAVLTHLTWVGAGGAAGASPVGSAALDVPGPGISAPSARSDQISVSPVCVTEVHWSFHQLRCCTDVAQTLSSGAFPRRARPEAGTSRGRKVELISEGYQSVPETADVSSTGNVLPSPASKALQGSRRPSVPCAPLRAFPPGDSGRARPRRPRVPPGQAESPPALRSRLAPAHPRSPGKAEWECSLPANSLPRLKQEGFWPPKGAGVFPPAVQPSEQAVSPQNSAWFPV